MKPAAPSTTTHVRLLLDRLARRDPHAHTALFEHASQRLRAISRRQLRAFAAVARWEQTEDLLQGAAVRLHRALQDVHPPTPADFFRLCSALIRRELIDLKRKLFGPQGLGAHHASPHPRADQGNIHPGIEQASDTTFDPLKLARWTELHDRVEKLPAELRDVFDLVWYQDLTHAEAAEALGVSVKTISRRWRDARLALHHLLEDDDA